MIKNPVILGLYIILVFASIPLSYTGKEYFIGLFYVGLLALGLHSFRNAFLVGAMSMPLYFLVRAEGDTIISAAFRDVVIMVLTLCALFQYGRVSHHFDGKQLAIIISLFIYTVLIGFVGTYHLYPDMQNMLLYARERLLPMLVIFTAYTYFRSGRSVAVDLRDFYLLCGMGVFITASWSLLSYYGIVNAYRPNNIIGDAFHRDLGYRSFFGFTFERAQLLMGFGNGSVAGLMVSNLVVLLYYGIYGHFNKCHRLAKMYAFGEVGYEKRAVYLIYAVSSILLIAAALSGSNSAVMPLIVFCLAVVMVSNSGLKPLYMILGIIATVALLTIEFEVASRRRSLFGYGFETIFTTLARGFEWDMSFFFGVGPAVRTSVGEFGWMGMASAYRKVSYDFSFFAIISELGIFVFIIFVLVNILAMLKLYEMRYNPIVFIPIFMGIFAMLPMIHGVYLWTPVVNFIVFTCFGCLFAVNTREMIPGRARNLWRSTS